ncbi:hypothetical protein CFC21_099729 [Triticum aestivum]|uniref:Uncharacterized protein n=2 Tax=Triticum aestivum TaxID=4565 RepID=A0A3B6NJ60_WHEAT|nr:hypothetical protein CFC21_099729 [Triticum aestivum]
MGLKRIQAPSKPDAVLAFLADLGLSTVDVTPLVAKDPKLLCAGVDRSLAPNVADLTGLGWSHSEVAQLVAIAGAKLRPRSVVSKLQYFRWLFGSFENLLRTLKLNANLLQHNLDRAVKPNVAFLRECGLDACAIAKLCGHRPRLLTADPERVWLMAASAERIGVPRESRMFRHALHAVSFQSDEKITTKVGYLKNTFRWSDAEAGIAVSNAPTVLRKSKESLRRSSEFFFSVVGLEPAYIAQRPVIISYSLEGRLRPRYCVVEFLKENGLVKRVPSWHTIFNLIEKEFMERYICPHMVAAPHLAEDYAAACRGEMPTSFRFT